jgi:hypothetical protein
MADRGSSAEQRAAIARQRRAAVANAGSFYEHAPLPSDKDIQNAMLAGRTMRASRASVEVASQFCSGRKRSLLQRMESNSLPPGQTAQLRNDVATQDRRGLLGASPQNTATRTGMHEIRAVVMVDEAAQALFKRQFETIESVVFGHPDAARLVPRMGL